MNAIPMDELVASESSIDGEEARFRKILRDHAMASGDQRARLRKVLVEYLRFSPQSDALINGLILDCMEFASPERLDIAIDILSQLGCSLVSYTKHFLLSDVSNWNNLYTQREYEPDDDYCYVLLRSLARANVPEASKLSIILGCVEGGTRGILEAVVEALADMKTSKSHYELVRLVELTKNSDPFIAELAQEHLEA